MPSVKVSFPSLRIGGITLVRTSIPFYTHTFYIDCCADVAGFPRQEEDIIYTLSPELIAFLSEGPPPIYVKYVSPSYNFTYT